MRGLVFHAPGDVRVETVAQPVLRGPNEAIVRVTATAVCGSDLHVYRGRETGLDAGTVLGHEFVGVVEETSPGTGLAPGQRVVAPFTTSCGDCFYCRRGLTARCERGELFGWVERGAGLHGAQAERVRVPLAASTLVGLPDEVPDGRALLAADVLATGSFAADLGGVEAGSTVAVLGCGPVGLMAVAACRRRGAARILAVDRLPERLALAHRFGGEPVDFERFEPAAVILEATAGRGVDAVLEVVGTPEATRLAVDLVRPGGVVAAVGVHTEHRFAFAPGEAYDKNLTYRAGRCPARHYLEPLLAELAASPADLDAVWTHRLPLTAAAEAYALFDARRDGCVKVLLTP
ncbi:MAG: alcohol dehydrogenase catalytic domain-containing protein [Thermoanaerobaculia bacterium]